MIIKSHQKIKNQIEEYLIDTYCMKDSEVYEFLDCISAQIFNTLTKDNSVFTMIAFIETMIRWGNKKVERVARSL